MKRESNIARGEKQIERRRSRERFGRGWIGFARRVRVRTLMGSTQAAWDCRRFGHGRVVAPKMPVEVELTPGTELNLETGEIKQSMISDQ